MAARKNKKKTTTTRSGKHITHAALVTYAAEQAGVSKAEARKVVRALVDGIVSSVARGTRVHVSGLGSFSLRKRKAMPARTMKSFGKMIKVKAKPAGKKPGFRFAKTFKEAV